MSLWLHHHSVSQICLLKTNFYHFKMFFFLIDMVYVFQKYIDIDLNVLSISFKIKNVVL